MFIRANLVGHGVLGQLSQHDSNIDQRIAATIHQHDRRLYVAGGKLSYPIISIRSTDAERTRRIIVVHLERLVPDDLEPVHHRLGAGKAVQMGIRSQFLMIRNVTAGPGEQEGETHINQANEHGWVEDGLPKRGGGKDGSSTKGQEEQVGRSLDQGVDDTITEACRRHCRCERNEQIDLVIEWRVYRQSRKCLCAALTESYVRQRRLGNHPQNVIYTVRNVVEGKLIHGKVPEVMGCGRKADRLFAIFVPPVITQPDVVTLFDQSEWQAPGLVGYTNPDVTVH